MSDLNKGIDLNKKKETKDLVNNLQGTADKVGSKIDSTMDSLDDNSNVQKIGKSKVVKKALNSKVVNKINENLISSLKLIFIIIGSFFIVLGITGLLIFFSRLDKLWIGLKLLVTFKDFIGGLLILLFLFLSLLVSVGDIIAGFAIIKQKKWGKTILLIMLVIGVLLFLLSLVYLKDIFAEGNQRADFQGYVPNTLGAIFRLTFYMAITLLVFKNYDIIVGKEKASDDEDYEEEETYDEENN